MSVSARAALIPPSRRGRISADISVRLSSSASRVECRQETRTGNTAVGYRRTGRKMLRRRGPRRNHRIGKSEDPSDPSDDHAYSPPMIQYSPKSNALVHWRQTLSTHCHRGHPYMHTLCAVVINHYECPKQIAFSRSISVASF